ncbi:MAG: T9SS type A sorting domain-containing protein [Flavobacteriales bacterium]|nr:T9SS type A sorting domain-containing protein [Flavobacteriales bacterium]
MRYLVQLPFIFLASSLQAQQNTVAAGGDAAGIGGSVSYSIGQVDYLGDASMAGSVSQGVQQPYEIFSTDLLEVQGFELTLTAYPNPAHEDLWLHVRDAQGLPVEWMLTDESGRTLAANALQADRMSIPINGLPSAVYILQVRRAGELVKSFRIIKR